MTNSRALRGTVLLKRTVTASSSTTETYTAPTPIADGLYKEIVLTMEGHAAAALAINLKISGLAGTGYNSYYIKDDETTISGVSAEASSAMAIIDATLLSTASHFFIKITFYMNTELATDYIYVKWSAHVVGRGTIEGTGSVIDTTLDSINLAVSTSNFTDGSVITIWGIP